MNRIHVGLVACEHPLSDLGHLLAAIRHAAGTVLPAGAAIIDLQFEVLEGAAAPDGERL